MNSVPHRAKMAHERQEAPLSDCEPIPFRPRPAGSPAASGQRANGGPPSSSAITVFDRGELNQILAVYGRKVAAGEWRDYALDWGRDRAVFAVFQRTSEHPLFRIEKSPRLARKQGAFSVVAATGAVLKRGHDLARVLGVLEKRVRVVER